MKDKFIIFICGIAIGMLCLAPMVFDLSDGPEFVFKDNVVDNTTVEPESLDQLAVDCIPDGMCKIAHFISGGKICWVGPELFTKSEGHDILEYERREYPHSYYVLVYNKTSIKRLKHDVRLKIARKSNASVHMSVDKEYAIDPNGLIWDVSEEVNHGS